jgi:hypothetical protein
LNNSFRHHRKAASVFPDPVGEKMRVFLALAILGQLAAWGGLGCPNLSSNQAHTYGSNREDRLADTGSSRLARSLVGISSSFDGLYWQAAKCMIRVGYKTMGIEADINDT